MMKKGNSGELALAGPRAGTRGNSRKQKHLIKKQWLFVLGLLAAIVAIIPFSLAAGPTLSTSKTVTISDGVVEAIRANGQARVIVTLHDPVAIEANAAERSQAIAQAQNAVLSQLEPADFQLLHRYSLMPGLAGMINQRGLALLLKQPQLVAAVHLDERGSGRLGDSVPALQADIVHANYGITGDDVRVAVLDSGASSVHPDLIGSIIAQHCFTNQDCAPNNSNESNNAEDEYGHGTNVTGIITSDGNASEPGFAPDSKIVSVRVLDEKNVGWVSDWIAGLNWVRVNLGSQHTRIVNMSLGTWQLYNGNCNGQQPLFANAVAQLRAQGVVIFASTGNEGSANSIAAPACLSGVVAVGATYDSDLGREPNAGSYAGYFGGNWPDCFDESTSLQTITCFTNSNSLVDIVAPGARITSSGMAGGTSVFIGTSQASATAAGVAALLLEASPNLTPTEIETILEQSGTPLVDPKNGLSFPLINALAAIQELPIPAAIISGPDSGVIQTGYAFTATVGSAAAQPITYTWQATGQLPITVTTGLSYSHVYTWTSAGVKTIQVTAANISGIVTTSHTITLSTAAVSLIGPAAGLVDTPYAFTAAFAPITTTLPFTYTWEATGQLPISHTAGLTDTAVFTWTAAGPITISVTLQNSYITISQTRPFTVYDQILYLPAVLRK